MADNWFSEIELQKAYSLSPQEAFCQVCAGNGLKMKEIAALAGISPETVHTFLQRGSAKMKKESKKVDLIILKGDSKVEGLALKLHAMKVLLEFVSMALDIQMVDGKSTMGLRGLDPTKPGDAQWLLQNVFRKADLFGAENDAAIKMRAEKLISIYNQANDGAEKVGMAIIKYYLDQMYMQYDIWE